uniref:hypothetical protein n=1 Tax=Burkholderia arboris TaxID=488730 RepID=UPI003BEF368D
MLIREQGRLVKVLRLKYSDATKRNRHVVIGAFRVDEGVPPELIELLARSERRELLQWLAAYRDSQAMARTRTVLADASMRLDELAAALEAAAGLLEPAEADALWCKLQAIARSLHRGGHPRPKRPRRSTAQRAPVPGQMDLVDELAAPSPPLTENRDAFIQ